MFTGIIEEVGHVSGITKTGSGYRIEVECAVVLEGTLLGDSIAVNGVCLTVTGLKGRTFTADVMNETVRMTSLKDLRSGHPVNLERALTLEKRLGGHIVSGHVDSVGKLKAIRMDGFSKVYEIDLEKRHLPLMIHKGSICINGISLTVSGLHESSFEVSLIPHSMDNTTMPHLSVGDEVNLEFDIIGKYVRRLLGFKSEGHDKSSITMDYLAEKGFL
jgi:riboflavin synthase